MKLKDLRDCVLSLIIGCAIGTIVTLPFKLPAVQDYIARAVSKQSDASPFILQESNADHGDTLEEVIEGIRNEKYEYTAIFQDGCKILEVTIYDEHRNAYIAKWPESMASGMVELHNHPIPEFSFSYLDLDSLCSNRLFETAIVVGGNTVYILSAPNGWPEPEEMRGFLSSNYGIEFDSDGNMLVSALQFVDLVEEGYWLVSGSSTGFSSKTINEFAECFGLIYTVEYLPCRDDDLISGYLAMPTLED